MRLLLLLEKTLSVVRFTSAAECDALFVELADFTSSALEKKKRLREEAARASLEELINDIPLPDLPMMGDFALTHPCSPFGVCEPSATNEQLCYCCDDGSVPAGFGTSGSDSVEACAQCLCSLQRPVVFANPEVLTSVPSRERGRE